MDAYGACGCPYGDDRQMEHLAEGWAGLAVQVDMALHWCLDQNAEPSVALHMLRKYLTENPAPMDALDARSD